MRLAVLTPLICLQALVAKCTAMTEALTGALHSSARRELDHLLAHMAPSSYTLTKAPATLSALSKAMDHHKCCPLLQALGLHEHSICTDQSSVSALTSLLQF